MSPAWLLLMTLAAAGGAAPAPDADARQAAPRVAVLDFSTSAPPGPLDGLKKALPGMLLADLQDPRWTLVEREEIQAIIKELKLSEAAGNPATALKLGKMVQATHLITGNYTELRGRFVFTARMFSTETTEQVATFRALGRAEEFDLLEQRFAAAVRERLVELATGRAPPPTKAEPPLPATKGVKPATEEDSFSLDDAVLYGQALDAQDQGQRERAVDTLQALSARSPGFGAARRDLDRLTRVHALPTPASP